MANGDTSALAPAVPKSVPPASPFTSEGKPTTPTPPANANANAVSNPNSKPAPVQPPAAQTGAKEPGAAMFPPTLPAGVNSLTTPKQSTKTQASTPPQPASHTVNNTTTAVQTGTSVSNATTTQAAGFKNTTTETQVAPAQSLPSPEGAKDAGLPAEPPQPKAPRATKPPVTYTVTLLVTIPERTPTPPPSEPPAAGRL